MSNLLKKASIITTPTAYDNGRILSVKPSENLYGSELVTNGDFATDTDWTKQSNWTIANGSANSNGSGSIFQNASFITGRTYKAFFEITSISSGRVSYRTNTSQNYFNEIGTHTVTWVYDGSFNFIYLLGDSNFVGSIDNVSVVEDLSGDFNFERGSAATRVNAQGLVENVQILSSELVQNGNFSEIGSEEVTNGDFSQEGSELVVNGDFATDSDWSKGTGWVISGGKANCEGTQSGNTNIYQSISFVVGKVYKVTYELSNVTFGSSKIVFGDTGGTLRSSNGIFTEYYTFVSGSNFYIQGNSTFTGSIDNVSVKEVRAEEVEAVKCLADAIHRIGIQDIQN